MDNQTNLTELKNVWLQTYNIIKKCQNEFGILKIKAKYDFADLVVAYLVEDLCELDEINKSNIQNVIWNEIKQKVNISLQSNHRNYEVIISKTTEPILIKNIKVSGYDRFNPKKYLSDYIYKSEVYFSCLKDYRTKKNNRLLYGPPDKKWIRKFSNKVREVLKYHMMGFCAHSLENSHISIYVADLNHF